MRKIERKIIVPILSKRKPHQFLLACQDQLYHRKWYRQNCLWPGLRNMPRTSRTMFHMPRPLAHINYKNTNSSSSPQKASSFPLPSCSLWLYFTGSLISPPYFISPSSWECRLDFRRLLESLWFISEQRWLWSLLRDFYWIPSSLLFNKRK